MGRDTLGITCILEGRQPSALSESERKVIIEAIEANVGCAPDIHAHWAQTVGRPYFDQLASLQKAGLDLGSLPDLRSRPAQRIQGQAPLEAVGLDLDRCDAYAEVTPPYDIGTPQDGVFQDGPFGFKLHYAVTDPNTGTMSLAAAIGNTALGGGRYEGRFDWLFGKMN